MRVVVDASAVLALLLGEAGSECVLAVTDDAEMTAVNLSECMQRAIDRGHRAKAVSDLVTATGVRIVPFDERLALMTAELRSETRNRGISLCDRACLALARMHGVPVYTADQRWADLDVKIDIRMIR